MECARPSATEPESNRLKKRRDEKGVDALEKTSSHGDARSINNMDFTAVCII